jgi:hypothetical protein
VIFVDGSNLYGAASGTVYIDDITFGAAVAPIWVDTYNDGADPNACNGTNPSYGTGCITSYNNTVFYSSPYSRKCDASTCITSGNFVHFINGQDVSQCTHLQFYVRGAAGGENPVVRLVASSINYPLNLGNYVTVLPSAFSAVSMPLTDFTALANLTSCAELDVDVNYALGNTGTVYLDNVQFVDTSVPTAPAAMTFNGGAVSNGYTISVTTGTLAANAAALSTDPKMEGVRFDYSGDGGSTWTTIGDDYSTTLAKSSFSAFWDLSALASGSYLVRATSRHVGGTSALLSYNINYGLPSATPTSTPTPSATRTPTQSASATPSSSVTATPSESASATPTPTMTATASISVTATQSASVTSTPSATSTATISVTATPSASVTATPTTTSTPRSTLTSTASVTASSTPSRTATATITFTPSVTPVYSSTPVPPNTPAPTIVGTLTPTPVGALDVRLSQNLFRPGQGETLSVFLLLPDRGQARVTVYSRLGDKLVELYNTSAGPGMITVPWNGRTSGGKTVSSGVYIIYVEIGDQHFRRLIAVVQ